MTKDCKILFVANLLCQNIDIVLTLRVYLGFVHITLPSSKIFLLMFPRRCIFCGSFMLFLSCFFMFACTSVCLCLVATCLERADPLALVCDV